MESIDISRDYGLVDPKYIKIFSKEVGFKLPEKYCQLISKHNALRPLLNFFDYKYANTVDHRDVNFLGFGPEVDEDLLINDYQRDEASPEAIVVFAIAANGDYICFDYRNNEKSNDPSIILMFHDNFDEDSRMITVNVALNFDSFLKMLRDV